MKPVLSPYLNFNGNAAEAMRFYQSVLGGELTVQTFGEAGMAKKPEEKDRTLHAALKNDLLSFMASDGHPDRPVKFGDNIHMSLMGSEEDKLTGYFTMLGQGGKVHMPLAKQFWGDTFGMLTDKYGVQWMINIAAKKQ
jgi:PhnB protein